MCRTTLLLGPKKSDGPIDRKPREIVLSLSRKIKKLTSLYPFFFLLHVWSFFFHFPSFSPTNSFPLFLFLPFSFLFCFSHFFLLIPFHFLLISSFLFALSLLLFGALTIWVKRRKFPPPPPPPPPLLKPNVWLSIFLYLFLISLFPL